MKQWIISCQIEKTSFKSYNLIFVIHTRKWNKTDKWTDFSFVVGDWVYLELQPYRQLFAKTHKHQKLSKLFYEPFKIIQIIGVLAYKQDLPSNIKIHHVFHIYLLKPHHREPPKTPTALPTTFIDSHPILTPTAILAKRTLGDSSDTLKT